MAAKPNPQIGTCPCPIKGCEELMAVKRFASRTDDPVHQRKAGKLYGDCPVDGRIGGDGSKKMQEYLLEKSTLWDPEETERQQAAMAAAELERKRALIQQRPATATPRSPAPASAPPKKSTALW